jgi:hypothetical protein
MQGLGDADALRQQVKALDAKKSFKRKSKKKNCRALADADALRQQVAALDAENRCSGCLLSDTKVQILTQMLRQAAESGVGERGARAEGGEHGSRQGRHVSIRTFVPVKQVN